MDKNLISLSKLQDKGIKTRSTNNGLMLHEDETDLMCFKIKNGLYSLTNNVNKVKTCYSSTKNVSSNRSLQEWHEVLGQH